MIIDTKRKSVTEIVGDDASAARLARGARGTVAPKQARNMAAAAQVAADSGKPAIAAALGVLAAGAVSPKSMKRARQIAGAAKNGDPRAANAIRKLQVHRAHGHPQAQKALDTIALAARVNHENERDLTPAQEYEAERSAARQAILRYNPAEDPIVVLDVEAARAEHEAALAMTEMSGPTDKFRQGERQIRDRPLKKLRFLSYRGRSAIVGRAPENYWLPGSDLPI